VAKDIFRVPMVALHDYDAFRALVEDAPSTHHAWAELFRKRSEEERRSGRLVREIHVDPREFAAHARLRGCRTSLATLEQFLIETDRHDT
jgi:hypothetical protein